MENKNGFTLIELLLTISIIAILAILLVPFVLDSRTRALDAGVISCLKQLSNAQEVRFVNNSSYSTIASTDPDYPRPCAFNDTNIVEVTPPDNMTYKYTASHNGSDTVFTVSVGTSVKRVP